MVLNGSYIPIGGALLLALSREKKSHPLTVQSNVFAIGMGLHTPLNDEDSMHTIAWDDGKSYITFHDGSSSKVPVSMSYISGLKELNRIKTLIDLKRQRISMNQAVRNTLLWTNLSEDGVMDRFKEALKMGKDSHNIDLFIDIESYIHGTPKIGKDAKYQIKSLIEELKDKNVGLYQVAAPVDSMPTMVGPGTHLAFDESEITIINKIA